MFCTGLRMSSKLTGPRTASILRASIVLMNSSAPGYFPPNFLIASSIISAVV
jgi:hypothetical protein